MSNLKKDVRKLTDELDAAGNTTAAIGKGFAMGSVGDAAQLMIEEIERQYPAIMRGEKPDHAKCIGISTEASLAKMIAPGAIVIISPLFVGLVFGYTACAGLLAGIIVSGIQIAFSASNTGGAWENCKKMVEAGELKRSSKEDGTGMLASFVAGLQAKGDAARALSGNPNLSSKDAGFDMTNPIVAADYTHVRKGSLVF